jgi:hypothetical protein|tara:strand:- start:58 stop:282 length:225 start_codon:yes stop_codon:yes gene_type:complete
MDIEKILSQTPLAVAISLHEKTFGYPPEFRGFTEMGDSSLAEEIHKSMAKGVPYDDSESQIQKNEDGTTTVWEW